MPEYLAPGVFLEEVSFRSKSIEGVPTSTTGFAGPTRTGPVHYEGGPAGVEPRLVTSFTEFDRVFGGLEPLSPDNAPETINYLAHAARAFFANGGKRLYVSRVFDATAPTSVASLAVPTAAGIATWRARWPGEYGNVLVTVRPVRSKNLAIRHAVDANDPLNRNAWGVQLQRVRPGAVVEVTPFPAPAPERNAPLVEGSLAVVETDANGRQTFRGDGVDVDLGNDPAAVQACLVELQVEVRVSADRVDNYSELACHPSQLRHIGKVLDRDDPDDQDAVVWLDFDPGSDRFAPARLAAALTGTTNKRLSGGRDGTDLPSPDHVAGVDADPDDATRPATGLFALGNVDDIAIVATPAAGAYEQEELVAQTADRLIAHAERLRYRIAVIDGPRMSSLNEIRTFRGRFDSKYAAIYHPWIEILDPLVPTAVGIPPRKLLLPPSGFVTGIYARSDIERGVHKAPANEVVRGLTRFEANINTGRQEVLNPEGINCLRFFEGRGNRVWGARTISSDPEWKYVNVRRLFIYIEHSLDKATQYAVFEPNTQRLWRNIRRSIEDFLMVLWRDDALIGAKPEDAFFVRCDRTTMTQNDLDNGRMICLVGVAPSRPAEFVIIRVGQWTADALN